MTLLWVINIFFVCFYFVFPIFLLSGEFCVFFIFSLALKRWHCRLASAAAAVFSVAKILARHERCFGLTIFLTGNYAASTWHWIDTLAVGNVFSIFCRLFRFNLTVRWLWFIFGLRISKWWRSRGEDRGLVWSGALCDWVCVCLDAPIYMWRGIGDPRRSARSLSGLFASPIDVGSGRAFPFFVLGVVVTRQKIYRKWKFHQSSIILSV